MGRDRPTEEGSAPDPLPARGRAIAYDDDEIGIACFLIVVAGLVPAIHVFAAAEKKDVEARDKRGHDELLLRISSTNHADCAKSDCPPPRGEMAHIGIAATVQRETDQLSCCPR